MLGNFLSIVTIDILSSFFFVCFVLFSFFWVFFVAFFVLMNYKLKGRDRAEASRDFAAVALGIGSLYINTPCLPPCPPPPQLLTPPYFCQLSSQQAQFGSVTKKENPTTWKRGANTCLCFIVCSFVCFKESYMTHSCFLKNKPNFSE